MKKRLFVIALFAIALGCKKDDPVTILPGGCSVTFKGTTHTLSVVYCAENGTVSSVSSADTNSTKGLVLDRDSSDPTSNAIIFTLDTDDLTGLSTYTAFEGITSQPTITVSGKTWTFSGTAENSTAADSEPFRERVRAPD